MGVFLSGSQDASSGNMLSSAIQQDLIRDDFKMLELLHRLRNLPLDSNSLFRNQHLLADSKSIGLRQEPFYRLVVRFIA